MKKLLSSLTPLASSCLALSVAAAAQSSPALDANAAPRMPRPPFAPSVSTQQLEAGAPTPRWPGEVEALGRRAAFESQNAPPTPLAARDGSARAHSVSISASDERYSRVYWDTDEHGTIWVRGRQYKASFDQAGATYMPLFGSEQPQHYPLHMSLSGAASDGQAIPLGAAQSAVRDGERVVLERGIIDEVYDVGVEGLEQTFVIGERPQGDFKLFVSLASEMARGERDDGFEFSNEFGAVRYGRAFVREADGTKRALQTRLVEGGVEIAVEREYLDSAQFPLIVDPTITTFDVDITTYDNFAPDVAYDFTTNSYLYVYEETVTATDHDVYSQRAHASGVPGLGAYVDQSADDWRTPSVANLNVYDQFLVAARTSGSGVSAVRARSVAASGAVTYAPVINVHTVALGSSLASVSVGGDPYAAGTAYYCVVFNETVPGPSNNIRARLVTSAGTLVGTGPIAVSTGTGLIQGEARVSKGNGETRWNIAWTRTLMPMNMAVYFAQLEWNGALTTPATQLATPAEFEFDPCPSSPDASGGFLVAWARGHTPTPRLIMGKYWSSGPGTTPTVQLSNTFLFECRAPVVDCDGQHFAVAYSEFSSATNSFDPFVTSVHITPSGNMASSEAPFAISPTTLPQKDLAIAAQASAGGLPGRFVHGWAQEIVPGQNNIHGAFYDGLLGGPVAPFCSGDGTGTACPCGNNGGPGRGCGNSISSQGARLVGSGTADLSSDTLVLTATGMPASVSCLFFQGTSASAGGAGSVFGDGLRCAAGSVIRLGTKANNASGSSSYPGAGDPSVSVKGLVPAAGAVRYYQAWYRNAAAFCTASTFNLTNGVSVSWLP